VTSIGLGIGLGLSRQKTTAERKWLWSQQMMMVGAIGFELMTSTV